MSNKPEDVIQASAFKWFHNNYCLKHHQPRMKMFAVQNEILSTVFKYLPKSVAMRLASKFKASGVLSGVSDLIVLLDSKTLFIELKNGSSGRQSKSQIEFQERVMNLGFKYYLCRSEEDFWGAINSEI